jgi:threonine/homoserine/homoserine lactone efflux protein
LPPAIWSFALTSLLIELTPGPNMTYLAIVSAAKGWRSGFATVAGVALGLAVLGLVAALGLAALIQSSEPVYQALRWAGVLYLLWLAYSSWVGDGENGGHPADSRYFLQGLTTNLLNPKAAVFYVAVLPPFIDPALPVLTQTIVLSLVYVAAATLVHSAIVLLAGSARMFLANAVWEQRVRRVLSVLLAGVAIWFAWSTSR